MVILGRASRRIKLLDKLREAIWNPLAYDVIVHGAQLVTYPGLYLRGEATLTRGRASAGLRFEIFHDLFHVSPS
jgi:hypothetical protein